MQPYLKTRLQWKKTRLQLKSLVVSENPYLRTNYNAACFHSILSKYLHKVQYKRPELSILCIPARVGKSICLKLESSLAQELSFHVRFFYLRFKILGYEYKMVSNINQSIILICAYKLFWSYLIEVLNIFFLNINVFIFCTNLKILYFFNNIQCNCFFFVDLNKLCEIHKIN